MRTFLIVLDGVGVGKASDASIYGDEGSDTLGNLARAVGGLRLPGLEALGLGKCSLIPGLSSDLIPQASYGRLAELSAGKDSVTGHWELAGLVTTQAFPVYPDGFPPEILELVKRVSGRGVIGNEVASGTEIMDRLGDQHVNSGDLILYTSADSVIQLLAHEEVVPLAELLRICEDIYHQLPPEHAVGRVIARPFLGRTGNYQRTANRNDYAQVPHGRTLIDSLHDADIEVMSIGKVDTLFAGRGFSSAIHTKNNADGIGRLTHEIENRESGFVFTNLIDFDMLWGHRNDIPGFVRGLEEFDEKMGSIFKSARPDDLFLISADHGNDPTTPSTDHSRENVPILAWKGSGGNGQDLGLREGFHDVAATIAEHHGLNWTGSGQSFYSSLSI